jgi:hypothetical protein
VRGWQPRGLGIERPHDHPVGSDRDGRAGFVVRVGIATLGRAREHISYSRNGIRRLRSVGFEVSSPFHGGCVCAHRWIANDLGISGHAREAVGAFSENDHFPICVALKKAHLTPSAWPPDVHASSAVSGNVHDGLVARR